MTVTTRPLLAALLGGLAVVGASGTAHAYWSAGGSGSHTVTTVDPAPVGVGATVSGALQPGARLPVTLTFTNPNAHPVAVTAVTPGALEVRGDGGCTTTSSAVTFAALRGDWQVPAGTGTAPGTLEVGPLADGVSMGAGASSACQGAAFSTTMTATGTVG